MNVREANKLAWDNKPNDLQWYLSSIEDRAKRGLFTAAFDFIPIGVQNTLIDLGYELRIVTGYHEVFFGTTAVRAFEEKEKPS